MSGREPIRMTDKPLTKIVKCAIGSCDEMLIVTTFLQPQKAKCPAHGGRVVGGTTSTVSTNGQSVTTATSNPAFQATPNPALVTVDCPMCKKPLKILRVNTLAHIEYGCTDSWCNTYVKIAPAWSHSVIKNCPEALKVVVEALNIEAVIRRQEMENANPR